MAGLIPQSPWKPDNRPQVYYGQRRPNYSDKIYECSWDLGVHGTILSLMNAVAVLVITHIRKDSNLNATAWCDSSWCLYLDLFGMCRRTTLKQWQKHAKTSVLFNG